LSENSSESQETETGEVTLEKRRVMMAWVFLTPLLVGIALVAGWPLLRTAYMSFTDASLASLNADFNWVGFENYRYLIKDPVWWISFKNTFLFAVLSVTIETILGLFIALALAQEFKGRAFLRAAVLVPWAIPMVVSAKMWGWMLNDQYGVVNDALLKLGMIEKPITWLADLDLSFYAIVAVDVWKTTPFMALLLLAGVLSIPKEVKEASRLTTKSWWKNFFYVTLPLLKPALVVAVIFRALDALRIFDLFYILASDRDEAMTMSVYARKQLIDFRDFGYGSSVSMFVFLSIAFFTVIYFTVTRTNVTQREI
jgi:trehalose/maltose transport system permease protein